MGIPAPDSVQKWLIPMLQEGAKELVAILEPHMNDTNANVCTVYVGLEGPKTKQKYQVQFTVRKSTGKDLKESIDTLQSRHGYT